jgi:hypothetical protein
MTVDINRQDYYFHIEVWEYINKLLYDTKIENSDIRIIQKVLITLSKQCFLDSDKALFIPINGNLSSPFYISILNEKCIHYGFENNSFAYNYWSITKDLIDSIQYHKDVVEIASQFIRGDKSNKINGIITDTIEKQLIDFSEFYNLQKNHANDIIELFSNEKIKSWSLHEHSFQNNTFITSIYRVRDKQHYSIEQSMYFKRLLLFLYRACIVHAKANYSKWVWIALLRRSGVGVVDIGLHNDKNDIYLKQFNNRFKMGNTPMCFTEGKTRFYWMKIENIYINEFEYRIPFFAVMACMEDDILRLNKSSIYNIL